MPSIFIQHMMEIGLKRNQGKNGLFVLSLFLLNYFIMCSIHTLFKLLFLSTVLMHKCALIVNRTLETSVAGGAMME